MELNESGLEKKWFYRLIKALCVFFLLVGILIGVDLVFEGQILLGISISIVVYVITNILKETLVYIVFGNKFSWIWLINIKRILKK